MTSCKWTFGVQFRVQVLGICSSSKFLPVPHWPLPGQSAPHSHVRCGCLKLRQLGAVTHSVSETLRETNVQIVMYPCILRQKGGTSIITYALAI